MIRDIDRIRTKLIMENPAKYLAPNELEDYGIIQAVSQIMVDVLLFLKKGKGKV